VETGQQQCPECGQLMARDREGRAQVITGALRNPRLRRVLVAFLLFNVAEWASWIAVLVWAYDWAGVTGASVVAVAQLTPAALLASPAATFLSRWSTARGLALGYLLQTLAYFLLGVALAVDAPVPVVTMAAMVVAVAVVLTRPAHNALLPEISDTTADLTAGNAASGTLEATAIVLGPILCSVTIAGWGPAGVVLVMAAATAIALVMTAPLATDVRTELDPALATSRAPSRVREVLADPAARVISAMVAAESVLVGMIDILLVFLALDVLDLSRSGPGILSSAIGVGGLVGAAFTFVLVGRQRLGLALLLAGIVTGVPFALTGASPDLAAACALLVMCGAGKAFFEVTARTFLHRLLPDRLLSAVFGLQESLMMGGLAVGAVAAPILVATAGPRGAFVVAGLFLPAITLGSWSVVRRLDARAAVPADVLDLLLGVPILAVLPGRIVERLAREALATTADAGSRLVEEGASGDRFYVIAAGEVSVSAGGRRLRELVAGGWFGELALLRDTPRSASVDALTDVSLWTLDRTSFLAAVAGSARSTQSAEDHARDHYR
jgi:predicted MFS family arabinose efflux permease